MVSCGGVEHENLRVRCTVAQRASVGCAVGRLVACGTRAAIFLEWTHFMQTLPHSAPPSRSVSSWRGIEGTVAAADGR